MEKVIRYEEGPQYYRTFVPPAEHYKRLANLINAGSLKVEQLESDEYDKVLPYLDRKEEKDVKNNKQQGRELVMTIPSRVYNASCVKCDIVCGEMVKIGCIILCDKCFVAEFKTSDPVKEEREKYMKLVDIMKQKTLEEIER